jgi:multiple sugar transport system permease protein
MVSALRSFDLVSIMTNGGPANSSMVLALYAFQRSFGSLRFDYGAAIASFLFVAMSIGVAIFLAVTLRSRNES